MKTFRFFSMFFTVFFILILVSASFAINDEFPFKNREIPTIEKYPNTNYVIMYDEVYAKIAENSAVSSTEHEYIKILTRQGARQFSELYFPYSPSHQSFTVKKLGYWDTDGIYTSVPKDKIEEIIPPYLISAPIYGDIKYVAISIEDLEPNDILEYEIKITGKLPFIENNFFQTSYTQDISTMEESILKVELPLNMDVSYYARGYEGFKPEIIKGAKSKTFVWRVKNSTPLKKETASPPPKEIYRKIMVSSFSDWQQLKDTLWQLTKKHIITGGDIKINAEKLTKGTKSKIKKIEYIYKFVKEQIRTIDINYGETDYEPVNTSLVLKNGYGSPDDKNLLLVSLLKSIGIDAYPAVTNTADFGSTTLQIASCEEFNYLIAIVPYESGYLFLDASREDSDFSTLPADLQDRNVLILKDGRYEFIKSSVSSPHDNREEMSAIVSINEEGVLQETVAIREYGNNKKELVMILKTMTDDGKNRLMKAFMRIIAPYAEIEDCKFSGLDDTLEPFIIKLTWKAKNYAKINDNMMLFKLPVIVPRKMQDLVSETGNRLYPIYIGSSHMEEKDIEILLPAGWKLIAQDDKMEYDLNSAYYMYQIKVLPDRLRFYSKLVMRSPMIPLNECGKFKEMISNMLELEQKLFVLKKIDDQN